MNRGLALFSSGEFGGVFAVRDAGAATRRARTAASFDSQAFDLLVQRRERNLKALGRFGLVPVGAFEHVQMMRRSISSMI